MWSLECTQLTWFVGHVRRGFRLVKGRLVSSSYECVVGTFGSSPKGFGGGVFFQAVIFGVHLRCRLCSLGPHLKYACS